MHPPEAVLDVVRADRDRRRAQHAARQICTRRTPASPLVTNARPSPNVTCCGAASAALHGARRPRARRSAPAVTQSRPSGRDADVVRAEAGRQRDGVPQRRDVDDGDVLGGRAEADPEPAARPVDRQVARPAGQLDAPEYRARARRRAPRRCCARVGDERVPAVGMRGRVARLDEARVARGARRGGRRSRRRRPPCGRRPRGRRPARSRADRPASGSSGRRGTRRGRRPRAAPRRRT